MAYANLLADHSDRIVRDSHPVSIYPVKNARALTVQIDDT